MKSEDANASRRLLVGGLVTGLLGAANRPVSAQTLTAPAEAQPGMAQPTKQHRVAKDRKQAFPRQLQTDAMHNVQDYGAVGDGKTDDLAAINAALAAMAVGGVIVGKLYFPPLLPNGNRAFYNVNSHIQIGDGTKFLCIEITGGIPQVGNNNDIVGTVWTSSGSVGFPAADDVFRINPGSTGSVAIRNLTIDGNGDNHTGACIRLGPKQFGALLIENCAFAGGGYGIYAGGVDLTNPCFRRCHFTNHWIASFGFNGGIQNGLWDHCVFDPVHTGGVHILGEVSNGLSGNPFEGSKFHKCVFEGSPGNSFQMNPGARQLLGLIFDSCWWEANQGAMFYINSQLAAPSMTRTTFMHCHFVGSLEDTNHIIYAPPGPPGGGNRIENVTFINSQTGGRGANARVLKVDAAPSNPTQSHFRNVRDVDGTLLGPEGDGMIVPWLSPGLGGAGTHYGWTPVQSSGGHYPKFVDPINGVFCETPLQIWSQDGSKFVFNQTFMPQTGKYVTMLGDVLGLQFNPTKVDPNTSSWGAAQKGAMWFNSTTNLFKMWNGSAIKTISWT